MIYVAGGQCDGDACWVQVALSGCTHESDLYWPLVENVIALSSEDLLKF